MNLNAPLDERMQMTLGFHAGHGRRVPDTQVGEWIDEIALVLKEYADLKEAAEEAYRLLGKVVPKDQNDMIRWAVASKDAVYTNAGAAYRTLMDVM